MRPAHLAGAGSGGLAVAVVVLASSGLATGCSSSSSKPTYCTDASKTSVLNLGNVALATNGLGSLQTALSSVQADANTFAADAKSAYPSQTVALNTALSGLQTGITSARGQPPLTAATAVASSVTQVRTRRARCKAPYQETASDQGPADAPADLPAAQQRR